MSVTNGDPARLAPATSPTTETLDCGCEWRIEHRDLSTCCVRPCSEHHKYRGRVGLLPSPLPQDFRFVSWIAANVRMRSSRHA